MKRLLLFALGLALIGCEGAGGRTGTGPDWLTAEPAPVTLDLQLEGDRAVEALVTPEHGGRLVATASDGTRYRLRIPEGAVLGNVKVTMTPVGEVRGLPVAGGSLAAVRLEPDGLRLMEPAELTILTERAVPPAERIAFGYFGDGADAHLYPVEWGAERITMRLLHFSGYGVAGAAADDPGRAALQRAASMEARLSARIADAMRSEGDAGEILLGPVQAAFVEYYDVALRPLMQIAETDDRQAACCITRYFTWERQVTLLFGEGRHSRSEAPDDLDAPELDRRRAEASESFERIFRNAVEKGVARAISECREEHDLGAIMRLLRLQRQAALLGLLDEAEALRGLREVEACATFELEFRSTFENRGRNRARFLYEVAADLPVEGVLLPPSDDAAHTAPLRYVRYEAEGNTKEALFGDDTGDARDALWEAMASHTSSPAGTRPGTFTLLGVGADWNVIDSPTNDCDGRDATEERDVVTGFYVVFAPGVPTELTRATPVRDLFGVGPQVMEDVLWAIHWSNNHQAERVDFPFGDPETEIDDAYMMTLLPTGIPGEWGIDLAHDGGEEGGFSLVERGGILLRHTPR